MIVRIHRGSIAGAEAYAKPALNVFRGISSDAKVVKHLLATAAEEIGSENDYHHSECTKITTSILPLCVPQ